MYLSELSKAMFLVCFGQLATNHHLDPATRASSLRIIEFQARITHWEPPIVFWGVSCQSSISREHGGPDFPCGLGCSCSIFSGGSQHDTKGPFNLLSTWPTPKAPSHQMFLCCNPFSSISSSGCPTPFGRFWPVFALGI